MTSTTTFKAAHRAIKKSGWHKRWPRGPKGEYTILSAIKANMRHDEMLIDYQEAFLKRLGYHVDHWETHPNRTKREVLDLLKSM